MCACACACAGGREWASGHICSHAWVGIGYGPVACRDMGMRAHTYTRSVKARRGGSNHATACRIRDNLLPAYRSHTVVGFIHRIPPRA